MLFTGISSAILAVVAAGLSTSVSSGRASELWLIVMVGAFALAIGSVVGLWASDDRRLDWKWDLKVIVSVLGLALIAPAILAGLGLFALVTFPALLVLILPVLGLWEVDALTAPHPVAPPRRFEPRHA